MDGGVAPPRVEMWAILVVNMFDSDRKWISVLARSPLEFGSIHVLLCKGANLLMLLEGVCEGFVGDNKGSKDEFDSREDNPELDSLLGMQAHLDGKESCVRNIE